MNNKKAIAGLAIAAIAVLALRAVGKAAGPIIKRPGDTATVVILFEARNVFSVKIPVGFYLSSPGLGTYSSLVHKPMLNTPDWQSYTETVSLILPTSIKTGLYDVRVFAGGRTHGIFVDYPGVYKVER